MPSHPPNPPSGRRRRPTFFLSQPSDLISILSPDPSPPLSPSTSSPTSTRSLAESLEILHQRTREDALEQGLPWGPPPPPQPARFSWKRMAVLCVCKIIEAMVICFIMTCIKQTMIASVGTRLAPSGAHAAMVESAHVHIKAFCGQIWGSLAHKYGRDALTTSGLEASSKVKAFSISAQLLRRIMASALPSEVWPMATSISHLLGRHLIWSVFVLVALVCLMATLRLHSRNPFAAWHGRRADTDEGSIPLFERGGSEAEIGFGTLVGRLGRATK